MKKIDGLCYAFNEINHQAQVRINYDLDMASRYEIVIPEYVEDEGLQYKVTNIGRSAFMLHDMNRVFIPSGVKEIESKAFCQCRELEMIMLRDGLTHIGPEAFAHCAHLMYVTLPEGLQQIGEAAFYDCKSLIMITIPSTVKHIAPRAFFGCDHLERVTILGRPDYIPGLCFEEQTIIKDNIQSTD